MSIHFWFCCEMALSKIIYMLIMENKPHKGRIMQSFQGTQSSHVHKVRNFRPPNLKLCSTGLLYIQRAIIKGPLPPQKKRNFNGTRNVYMQRGSVSGPCQMSIDTPTKQSNAQHLVEYKTKKNVMQQPMDSYVCGINTSSESILIMSYLLFPPVEF